MNMQTKLPLKEVFHEATLSSRSSDKLDLGLSDMQYDLTWHDFSINTCDPIRLRDFDDKEELCCYDEPNCLRCDSYKERLNMCLEDIRSSHTRAKVFKSLENVPKFTKTPSRLRFEVPALFPKDSIEGLRDRLVSSMRTVFSGSKTLLHRELEAVDQVFNELAALKSKYEAPRHSRTNSAPMHEDYSEKQLLDQLTNELAKLEKQRGDSRRDENTSEELARKLGLDIAALKSKILKLRSDIAIKEARDNSTKANHKIEALNKQFELETQRSRSRTKLSFSRESSAEKQPLSCDVTRDGRRLQRDGEKRTAYNLEQEKEAMSKLWKLMHKRIAHTKESLQAKRQALDKEKLKLKEERAALAKARQKLQMSGGFIYLPLKLND